MLYQAAVREVMICGIVVRGEMWGEKGSLSSLAATIVVRGDRKVESEERELVKLDRAVVKLVGEEGVSAGLAVEGVLRVDGSRCVGVSAEAVQTFVRTDVLTDR